MQMEELKTEISRKEQEVKDRDAINEFLRNEIRMADMKVKVKWVCRGGGRESSMVLPLMGDSGLVPSFYHTLFWGNIKFLDFLILHNHTSCLAEVLRA